MPGALSKFVSQDHRLCAHQHHFEGDFISPCSDAVVDETLFCAHKELLGVLPSVRALEELTMSRVIDDDQKRKLTSFVNRIDLNTVAIDLAATTTSLHLRHMGITNNEHLRRLGLRSFEVLEAMSLDELKTLVGKKSREANSGLLALKFTMQNVQGDMRKKDFASAKSRMEKFIAKWIPDITTGPSRNDLEGLHV